MPFARVLHVPAILLGAILALGGPATEASVPRLETVPTSGDGGFRTSLVLDRARDPHIAGSRPGVEAILYLVRRGDTWIEELVPAEGYLGERPGLALDAAGSPVLAWFDRRAGALKVQRWSGDSWRGEPVDDRVPGGGECAVAFAPGDELLVLYRDAAGRRLGLARESGGQWRSEVLAEAISRCGLVDLALAPDGSEVVLFEDEGMLRLLERKDSSWTSSTLTGPGTVSIQPDLALDADGNPWVAYTDLGGDRIMLARREGGLWRTGPVEERSGRDPTLALRPDGRPVVAYHDVRTRDLRLALAIHSGWEHVLLDSEGNVGEFGALALDPEGNISLAYHDCTGHRLKFAGQGLVLLEPLGGEHLVPGEVLPIRWAGEGEATLGFSGDGGESWTLIGAGTSGKPVSWVVPDLPTRRGMIRVTRADPAATDVTGDFLIIGEGEADPGLPIAPRPLRAHPLPYRGGDLIVSLTLGEEEGPAIPVHLTLIHVSGRRVRELADELHPPGSFRWRWDGRDSRGVPVPPGVYFLRGAIGNRLEILKITILPWNPESR